MSRPVVVAFPRASTPEHLELAVGVTGVWVGALAASRIPVCAPSEPFPPDSDPYAAARAEVGLPRIPAVVTTHVDSWGRGWAVRVEVVPGEGLPPILRRRFMGGPVGIVRGLEATIPELLAAFDRPDPGVGWQALLGGVQTASEGVHLLRCEGAERLERLGFDQARVAQSVRVLH